MAKSNIPYIDAEGQLVRECLVCEGIFPATLKYFYANKTSKTGIQSTCIVCRKKLCADYYADPKNIGYIKKRNAEYRAKPEIITHTKKQNAIYRAKPENKERQKQWNMIYFAIPENRERKRKKDAIYRAKPETQKHKKTQQAAYYAIPENLGKRKKYLATYDSKPENKERRNSRKKERRKNNLGFRLSSSLGGSMRHALRGNKNHRPWETLVDFTLDDLKKHLEKQFTEGMSWEKLLKGEIHIDHKIPVSAFNFKTPEDLDFRKCWSLKNLQPLWASDNVKKGAKLEKPFQPSFDFGGSI